MFRVATLRATRGVGDNRVSYHSTIRSITGDVGTESRGFGYCARFSLSLTLTGTSTTRGLVSSNSTISPLTNIPITVGSGVYAGNSVASYTSGVLCGFGPPCSTAIIGGLATTKVVPYNGIGVSRFTVNSAARASCCNTAGGP